MIYDAQSNRESTVCHEDIRDVIGMIEKKIKDNQVVKQPAAAPLSKILFTYADRQDKILLLMGFISASFCGFGLPSIVFLFGDIADSFLLRNPVLILDAITYTAKTLSIIGAAVGVCSYMFFTFFMIASERIGQKTRVAYLESVLN